jgi:hypothetical protein
VSTHADFQLRHEALEEAKRLVAHPRDELVRLEREAADGGTAASLLILVAGVFVCVWAIAAVLYALVVVATRVLA